MSWRDNLHPPSFRGVPFEMEEHDGSFGRRTVLHEYAKRDLPYSEDMGRSPRRFTVKGYVVGDDYMDKRNRLLEAIEQPGPGTLVHAYLGSMQVTVEVSNLAETINNGRMATFTIKFIEAGELTYPSTASNTGAVINQRADLAAAATQTDFLNTFVTARQPDVITTEAQAVLSGALEQMELAGSGLF